MCVKCAQNSFGTRLNVPESSSLNQPHHTLTAKPAEKNLGIVFMNTDDYIGQCLIHLTDNTTYRLTNEYPKDNICRALHDLITAYKDQLNKQLYKHLTEGPQKPRIPNSTEYLKYIKNPPIVSQSSSILSPALNLSTMYCNL